MTTFSAGTFLQIYNHQLKNKLPKHIINKILLDIIPWKNTKHIKTVSTSFNRIFITKNYYICDEKGKVSIFDRIKQKYLEKEINYEKYGFYNAIRSVFIHNNILVLRFHKSVEIYDLNDIELIKSIKFKKSNLILDDEETCNAIAVNDKIIAISRNEYVELYDHKGESLNKVKCLSDIKCLGEIQSLVISENNIIAKSCYGIYIIDIDTLNMKSFNFSSPFFDHFNEISVYKQTIIIPYKNTIKLFNFKGEFLKQLEEYNHKIGSMFVENGIIVTGGCNGPVKIWDMESGKCLKTLKGHKYDVTSVYISGNKIISSSLGTVKTWKAN